MTTGQNKKSIDVVAGIILDSGKKHILMSQRTDADYLGQWEFPGGKQEQNENPEAALIRELEEELAIRVTKFSLYLSKTHEYHDKFVNLRFYWVTEYQGTPKGVENQPIQWQPVKTIDKLNFLEANHGVMQDVQRILLKDMPKI